MSRESLLLSSLFFKFKTIRVKRYKKSKIKRKGREKEEKR